MAIKLKGWTERRPVKICCVIMIPLLLFISLYGVVGLAKLEYADISLVFTDLNRNDYFYDKYVPNADSLALMMFWLQNEDHIRNKGCLEWQLSEDYEYNEFGEPVLVEVYELISTNRADGWHMGPISVKDIDTPKAERLLQSAISQQLNDFYYTKNRLEEMPGLYYFITDGNRQTGNVPPDAGTDFFRSQPVYVIAEPGKAYEMSRTGNSLYPFSYYDNGYSRDSLSSYIAFSSEAVIRQNDVWKVAQRQLGRQLIIVLLPALIALALFVILMVGAGRKYNAENRKINFMAIDKPWLDLGLCLLMVYELWICYGFYAAISVAWRYDNIRWIYTLCAALSIFFTLPLLGWIVSFTKYCKAGKWWRHTLIYTLIYGICCRLQRLGKSLWSGFPLTLRAVLLGCGLLVVNVICVCIYPSDPFVLVLPFFIAAFAVFGLLR